MRGVQRSRKWDECEPLMGHRFRYFLAAGRPHSRASPLPHLICSVLIIYVMKQIPCGSGLARELARSASHSQGLAGGLRSRLKAIVARNKTLSSSTAHRPNFFQSEPVDTGPVDTGVTDTPPSTDARPNVASFAGL